MSTIAQTLSGAMGLLGAIVLFALQETRNGIERAAKRLAEVPHNHESAIFLRHLLTHRNFAEFAKRYGAMLESDDSGITNTDLLVFHAALTWELSHDQAIRRNFSKALVSSGIVIAFGILCCGLAPLLSENVAIGATALGVAIAGAIASLALYGILLRVMLRSTPDDDSLNSTT